jgi:Zn-finger nucleic acid-binding protein
LAELAAAAEEAKGPPREAHASGVHLEADVRYLSCPDCRETMSRMNFGLRSGVIVDVCQVHGTWFDRGERARVVDFVRMAGLPSAREAPHAPPLSRDAAASLGRAEALMQYETLSAEATASHAINLLDDLVRSLFGD